MGAGCGLSHSARQQRAEPELRDSGTPVDLTEVDAGSEPETPDASEAATPPDVATDTVIKFVRSGDTLAVMTVDLADPSWPRTRGVELPYPASDIEAVYAWQEGRVARITFVDGRTTLEAAGSPWTTLASAQPGENLSAVLSADGKQAWVSLRDKDGKMHVTSLGLETTSVGNRGEHAIEARAHYQWQAAAPGELGPQMQGFTPTGVLVREGLMLSHYRHGSPELVSAFDDPNTVVEALFLSSLIVRDARGLRWLSLTGEPLEVDDFVGKVEATRGTFQLLEGKLYRLHDREVRYVQEVGEVPSARAVVSARELAEPPLSLLSDEGRYWFVDGHGKELARYEAASGPYQDCGSGDEGNDPEWMHVTSIERTRITALMPVSHSCFSEDSIESQGHSLDLWSFDSSTGESVVQRLESYAEGDARPYYELSSGGGFAVAVIEGALELIDTTSGERHTLRFPDLTFEDWHVR